MRELKFRGWDGHCMHPAEDLTTSPGYREWLGKVDFELMQYTGLKDSDGVEIYEGDVVAYSRGKNDGWHKKSVVRFNKSTTQYQLSTSLGSHDLCKWYELKVIGNIHENPELMEADNE